MSKFTHFLLGVFVGVSMDVALTRVLPTDDTDVSWNKRSGMSLGTDYKTGRQYLMGPHGGITPRLDADGMQMMDIGE